MQTVTMNKEVLKCILNKMEDLDLTLARVGHEKWTAEERDEQRKWYKDLHKKIFIEK